MSDVNSFLVLTDAFAAAMQGKQVGSNVFNHGLTTDGRKVISVNAIHDFPEDFAAYEASGGDLTPVELIVADFPQVAQP